MCLAHHTTSSESLSRPDMAGFYTSGAGAAILARGRVLSSGQVSLSLARYGCCRAGLNLGCHFLRPDPVCGPSFHFRQQQCEHFAVKVRHILTHSGQGPGAIGLRLVFAGYFCQLPSITQRLRLGQKQGQFKFGAGLFQQFFFLGGRDRFAGGDLPGGQPEVIQPDRRIVLGKCFQQSCAGGGIDGDFF